LPFALRIPFILMVRVEAPWAGVAAVGVAWSEDGWAGAEGAGVAAGAVAGAGGAWAETATAVRDSRAIESNEQGADGMKLNRSFMCSNFLS
jgi:hypothetical protein